MKSYLLILLVALSTSVFSQTATDYIAKANQAIIANKSSYFINKYINSALKLDPNNNEALYLKAKTQTNAKHYKDALATINAVINQSKTEYNYFQLRAEIYAKLAADNHELEAGLIKAVEDLNQVIQLGGDKELTYLYIAKLYEATAKSLTDEIYNDVNYKAIVVNYFNTAENYYNKCIALKATSEASEKIRFIPSQIDYVNSL